MMPEDSLMEVPGIHIILDEEFHFPMVDVDENIPLDDLYKKIRKLAKEHQLGPYIVVSTKKGYKVAFTHDIGRPMQEINKIIKDFVDSGLCDPDFYRVGIEQGWRGWRISGKYKENDMHFITQNKTGFNGKPSVESYMLDAMFRSFYGNRR